MYNKKISIQKIHEKGLGIVNEDEFLIKNKLFAVFDGASSLVKFINKNGETGGKIAANIVKNVFSKNDKSLGQLAIESNNQILNEMKKANIDINEKRALWTTVAAAVRLKKEEAEFFNIGDCLILAISKDSSYKLLTPYSDMDSETMIQWKKLADEGVKDVWKKLKSKIEKVRSQANLTYGSLNGQKDAVNFFNFGKINLKDIKSIILFTDGLFIPKENPKESENWDLFVKLYLETGLVGILKHIRSIEKSDPNCKKYPRFKQHDDIAAIGIDFQ